MAQIADLITGGPGQRWGLTPRGEKFLTLPAVTQVEFLFLTWWYRVNWLFVYPGNLFGNELTRQFSNNVLASLRDIPVGQLTPFETYSRALIQPVIGTQPPDENNFTWNGIYDAIEEMVIKPLEKFGVLEGQYKQVLQFSYPMEKLESFSVTQFGHALLETI